MKLLKMSLIIFNLLLSYQISSTTIYPEPSDEILANPHMGWQTFYQFADEDPNLLDIPSSCAYIRFYWYQLEPQRGQINFRMIDSLLERAQQNNQMLAFRIMAASTYDRYMYAPTWLKEMGCSGFDYYYLDKEQIHWMPDIEDTIFLKEHYRLLSALAERYDGHPLIDYIDIGSVGLWGEWHFYATGLSRPSLETRIEIIRQYCECFPNTQKLMLINDADGLIYAFKNNCGWRADCFGDMSEEWGHMEGFYPRQIENSDGEDIWKTAPVAFETCWDIRKWVNEGWDLEYIFNYARNMHITYLNNKSAPIPSEAVDIVKSFLKEIGYRLVLKEISFPSIWSASESNEIKSTWENVGIAPPYHDYYLAYRILGKDSNFEKIVYTDISIKGWLPGIQTVQSNIPIANNMVDNNFSLYIAFLDKTTKMPVINIAINSLNEEGWYYIGDFQIQD